MALAFIAEGLPAQVVARRLGRNRGTVEAWGPRVQAHGLSGLQPPVRGPPGTVLRPAAWVQRRPVVAPPPRQVGWRTGTWSGHAVVA